MVASMIPVPAHSPSEEAAGRSEDHVWHEGHPVHGDFRCRHCGYGVSVRRELASCPMCGSTEWDA